MEWPLLVIKANPVSNDPTDMLQTLKTVAMHTLILERPDLPVDLPVLLRATGRIEFLFQPVAFDQGRVAAAGERQTVVRPRKEWLGY